MKSAVMFGACNIGRGFIGMVLAEAGYKVIFGDVNPVVIDRIAADKEYTVHIMDVEKRDVKITNVDGVMSNGPAIIPPIAEADLVTTAVGLVILPRVAPTMVEGIRARIAAGCEKPLNFIACENAIRASSHFCNSFFHFALNIEE